jgi:hypothetical protein
MNMLGAGIGLALAGIIYVTVDTIYRKIRRKYWDWKFPSGSEK